MKKILIVFGIYVLTHSLFALDAPQVSISASFDGDSTDVQLSWDSIPGATSYNVYGKRAYSGIDSLLDETSDTFVFISLPNDYSTNLGFFTVYADSLAGATHGVMITIPSGTFTMGQDPLAMPEHEVTLTHDFLLGKYEVTNQEYLGAVQWAFDNGYVTASTITVQAHGEELLDLNDNDCEISFSGGVFSLREAPNSYATNAFPDGYDPSDHPVKEVSWFGAACYCDWISLQNSLPAFYNGSWNQTASHDPYTAAGYRLPTEAEFEYTACYNDERTYPWGETASDCDYANYDFCVGWTSPVGSYPLGANQLGLMDMAGNLWEWLGDKYGSYSSSPQVDPYGSMLGSYRVVRGGYWYSTASYLRSFSRWNDGPSHTDSFLGFRLCRTANP